MRLSSARGLLPPWGLVVSLLSLFYLFLSALQSAQSINTNVLDLNSLTTGMSWAGWVASAVFAVLNIPPLLLFLGLEAFWPSSTGSVAREVVIYSIVTIAVVGWWRLIARFFRTKTELQKNRKAELRRD